MKKVLIVDDTKNIRKLLTTLLEVKNYEVLTAEDGKSAIDIIKNEKDNIDLIFLDIRMPEINGTEVLKKIRELDLVCPVIIMTAYATVKNAIDCTRLGAVAYLQKPFSPERVSSVMDEVLNKKSSFEQNSKPENYEEDIIINVKKLIEDNKLDDAHNELKKLLSLNPYNKEIYYLISKVNKGMGDSKKAKLFNDIYELFSSEL